MSRTAPGISRGRVYSAQDVAEALQVSLERVLWHCEVAQRLGKAADGWAALFFGAWKDGGEWWIPERVVRRASGLLVLQHYKLAEVAELVRLSVRTIRARLHVLEPGEPLTKVPRHLVGARLVFSTDLRVPGSEVDRILAGQVSGWPAGQGIKGKEVAA